MSDAALAGQIEEVTGIPVHFAGQAPAVEEEGAVGAAALAVWRERTGPAGVLWSGSLDALLDGWAEAAGYEWRFDEERERIEVVRFRSVVFHVHALAGSLSYSAQSSASDGGSTEGGSASSEHSLESSAEFNPWGEINDQLGGLVGEATQLTVSESSGTVVVAGVPGDVARVRAYLAHLNQEVLRPVTVSVHVYAVRMNRGANYNLGLDFGIGRLLGEMVGVNAVSDGSGSVSIVRPSTVETDTFEATVKALSESGRVSRVLSADVPSLNHKPAQFFELFKQNYVAEIKTTLNQDGNPTQTELVPGTVSSGFAFSFVPQITGPDEVLLKLFASLQDRPDFEEVGALKLPSYATRAVNLVQNLRRGETLVVTDNAEELVKVVADITGEWPRAIKPVDAPLELEPEEIVGLLAEDEERPWTLREEWEALERRARREGTVLFLVDGYEKLMGGARKLAEVSDLPALTREVVDALLSYDRGCREADRAAVEFLGLLDEHDARRRELDGAGAEGRVAGLDGHRRWREMSGRLSANGKTLLAELGERAGGAGSSICERLRRLADVLVVHDAVLEFETLRREVAKRAAADGAISLYVEGHDDLVKRATSLAKGMQLPSWALAAVKEVLDEAEACEERKEEIVALHDMAIELREERIGLEDRARAADPSGCVKPIELAGYAEWLACCGEAGKLWRGMREDLDTWQPYFDRLKDEVLDIAAFVRWSRDLSRDDLAGARPLFNGEGVDCASPARK